MVYLQQQPSKNVIRDSVSSCQYYAGSRTEVKTGLTGVHGDALESKLINHEICKFADTLFQKLSTP